MTRATALLDANILYPAPVRDTFPQLAADDLFGAKWIADIHREWMGALLRNEPRRDRAALERTRDLIGQATRDCLVADYETIPALDLPDPDDRHVLAAAIVEKCDVIITFNMRDFPPAGLKPYGIDAQHPGEFLVHMLSQTPSPFLDAIRKILSRLVAPPVSARSYVATLSGLGLTGTAKALAEFSGQLSQFSERFE